MAEGSRTVFWVSISTIQSAYLTRYAASAAQSTLTHVKILQIKASSVFIAIMAIRRYVQTIFSKTASSYCAQRSAFARSPYLPRFSTHELLS